MTTSHPRHGFVDMSGSAGPAFVAAVVALVAIWLSVLVISLLAPDSVSGTMQEHVPVAAILTWIWGLIASRSVVTTFVAHRADADAGALRIVTSAIVVVWLTATMVGIYGPELITGTDPTRFPISALVAPIAAMVLTTTTMQLFGAFASDK